MQSFQLSNVRAFKLWSVLVVMLFAVPAFAGNDDAIQEAERRFKEGVKLYEEKKYAEARTRFLEACAADRTHNCMKNLAMTEEELGMWDQAAQHWREFLEDPRTSLDPDNARQMDDFRTRSGRAKTKCVELEIVAPTGTLITVDQSDIGRAPLAHTLFVPPGTHVIVGRLEKERDEKRVTENAGIKDRVELSIKIGVGGANPPRSTHEETRMMPPPTGAIILAGVGVVGIGLGVTFGVISSSAKSDLENGGKTASGACVDMTSAACARANDQKNTANTMGAISIASYVAGGVALAGAALWWLLAPRKVRVVGVAPMLDRDGAGVSFAGRF